MIRSLLILLLLTGPLSAQRCTAWDTIHRLFRGLAFQSLPFPGPVAAVASGGTTVTFNSKTCTGSSLCTFSATPPAGSQIFGIAWSTTSTAPTTATDTGSTYTVGTPNTANGFAITTFFTSNFQGTAGGITLNGTVNYSVGIVATGGTTAGCNDGGGPVFGTGASGTALTGGSLTTTNAGSLLIGATANIAGSDAATAGTDGQGHTMTQQVVDGNGVLSIQTVTESATAVYAPTATLATSAAWKMVTFAIK